MEGPQNTAATNGQEPVRGESTVRSRWWKPVFRTPRQELPKIPSGGSDETGTEKGRSTWSMGILNDPTTDEVPGSVLLLSSSHHNEPLGLHHQPARTSASSLPSSYVLPSPALSRQVEDKKKTADGLIILDPQPDESLNDPLNWPALKRDVALLSLGFYCMVGGGMTPILAAGFTDVAQTYGVSIPQVARTTGLYMLGLGLGSVISSPTAILYGKRPVYLVGIACFCVSAVWCAASPSYISLVLARIVQGIAVSPCESLPSATIAEIFFLHERAYRVGVYTLLLLGGKNLIPLVSAAIIEGLGWRWVFWIVAMVVALCFVLLFLFVPETFWDRTPRPKHRHSGAGGARTLSAIFGHSPLTPPPTNQKHETSSAHDDVGKVIDNYSLDDPAPGSLAHRRQHKESHVGWVDGKPANEGDGPTAETITKAPAKESDPTTRMSTRIEGVVADGAGPRHAGPSSPTSSYPPTARGPSHVSDEEKGERHDTATEDSTHPAEQKPDAGRVPPRPRPVRYTTHLKTQPPRSFLQSLKPWNGRLREDPWLRVAIRPFILYAYPAVLWSTLVYSLSIGWLIVLSETVATIYRSPPYNFTALGAGLVYVSPFIGGVLGTAVAGKVSDVIVRFLSQRNGGLYEPEFRLVMAIPVAITTCIGLMGFGWSAQEQDRWIVPTVFFGVISFGCSLGSTTAITFCVDSYRQYAGEALVTLNFSKNVFHGLVFSLFFNIWLEADGSKAVFLAIGGIQLGCLLTTIPMYIYGKRARMWTVRRNLMENF
ncbi:MAG: hypothetical protein M1838_000553 [Thelocarpon superellum]|nr:MAG: hypothetical protein M1838_000553 [Thelocarpon superellum]